MKGVAQPSFGEASLPDSEPVGGTRNCLNADAGPLQLFVIVDSRHVMYS